MSRHTHRPAIGFVELSASNVLRAANKIIEEVTFDREEYESKCKETSLGRFFFCESSLSLIDAGRWNAAIRLKHLANSSENGKVYVSGEALKFIEKYLRRG